MAINTDVAQTENDDAVTRGEFNALKEHVNDIDSRGTRGTRVILQSQRYREVVIFGVIILLAIGLTYLFVFWQVDVSQHHWCDALNTLTQHPVPKPSNPASNPSREEGYILYQEFVKLKGNFGCG